MSDNNEEQYRLSMTNIIAESRHRTRFVKMIKKFTIDAQVSYQRIVYSLGFLTLLIAVTAFLLRSNSQKLTYVGIPIFLTALCFLVIIIMYVLSSRNKSLLSSVYDMVRDQLRERARRAASPRKTLRSVGVSGVTDGVIEFDNGDYGLMFDVEGQISFSVLPAVAKGTAAERHRYLIARPNTTQEMLITSVRKADVRSKLDALRSIYFEAKEGKHDYDPWREHMVSVLYNYIDTEMGQKETQTFQSLIIRDVGLEALKKARQIFESSCANGMYSSVTPVTSESEIARRMRAMTMLSNKGLSSITGRDESFTDVFATGGSTNEEDEK